jgi:predicted RNase H-like HicB family nuclease
LGKRQKDFWDIKQFIKKSLNKICALFLKGYLGRMEWMKKLIMNAQLPVIFLKEKGQFVAYTPALDLSTSGKTLAQAERNFVEAAKIFFEECRKMGTLDEVLQELGWEKHREAWTPPVVVVRNSQTVSVPLPV